MLSKFDLWDKYPEEEVNKEMKSFFPGYYKLTNIELTDLWENCIFVLDANTLLNLFRFSKESRDSIFDLLDSIKHRIWIPHQVALEYHRNLENVISSQKNEYKSIQDKCLKALQKLITEFQTLKHSNIDTTVMTDALNQCKETIQKELSLQESKHPDLMEIKERINNLIGENVGSEFSQEELEKIYSSGIERYKNDIPPGFKDASKEQTYFHNGLEYQGKYGDLIFWEQILNHAKKQEVKSIILISDDQKEDWVLKVDGEKKGPLPHLIHEFNKSTNGKLFYLYHSIQFVKLAKEYLGFDRGGSLSDAMKEMELLQLEDLEIEENKHYFKALDRSEKRKRLLELLRVEKEKTQSENERKEKDVRFHYKLWLNIEDRYSSNEESIHNIRMRLVEYLELILDNSNVKVMFNNGLLLARLDLPINYDQKMLKGYISAMIDESPLGAVIEVLDVTYSSSVDEFL